jgi:hypothetical protein
VTGAAPASRWPEAARRSSDRPDTETKRPGSTIIILVALMLLVMMVGLFAVFVAPIIVPFGISMDEAEKRTAGEF